MCIILTFYSNYINAIQTTDKNNPNAIYTIKFPMNYCGDYSAGGSNTWHYVYINYNQSNLTNIRNNFCCDAYYNKSNSTIVIASFYNKNTANDFMRVLNSKGFKGVKVGAEKIITASRSRQRVYSCR